MEDKNKKANNNNTNSKSNIAREELPDELKEIIQSIPDDKKDEVLRIITAQSIEHSTSFRGPLPPPSILDEYNNILDNGAERIMRMAENQSSHRIEMEK